MEPIFHRKKPLMFRLQKIVDSTSSYFQQFYDFLNHHPQFGFLGGVSSFIMGLNMDNFIEVTTPLLTWIGLVLGVIIAALTVIVRVRSLLKNINDGDPNT